MIDLIIVILNWNGYDDTRECLQSLARSSFENYKIVLVDNGSNDARVPELGKENSEIQLIQLDENLGYAAGNNIGINEALSYDPRAILLLNNDTILDNKCLKEMFDLLFLEQNTGAVVPKIYYAGEPERIWYAGGTIDWWRVSVHHHGFRQLDEVKFNSPTDIQFATGCALMFKTEVCRKIGILDDSFYSYYEDVDFSLRILQANFKIKYCPTAHLWHKVGGGTDAENYSPYYLYYQTRNRLRAFTRNQNSFYGIYVFFIHTVIYFKIRMIQIMLSPGKNRWLRMKAVALGYVHSLLGKVGPDKRWEMI